MPRSHGGVLATLAPTGQVNALESTGEHPQVLDNVLDAAFGTPQIAAPIVAAAPAPVGREDG